MPFFVFSVKYLYKQGTFTSINHYIKTSYMKLERDLRSGDLNNHILFFITIE